MNILTFDIEEWYLEKVYHGGRTFKYKQFEETFYKVLDELDELGVKATFFCVGQLAVEFPEVIKTIILRGHEIGCHSNVHTWLDKMDERTLFLDTSEALKALEDVSGQKVVCYRAPAFSITSNNKWAVNVLVDCGIEIDSSIFPTSRDFGGYKYFPQDTPCRIRHESMELKEFPISLISLMSKTFAYSGGGYFRLLPYWFVSKTMRNRDYNICYFHLADLISEKKKMMSKSEYEEYFKEPGTMKKRFMRYVKSNAGRGDVFAKLKSLLSEHQFVNIGTADKVMDWDKKQTIVL